MDSNKDISTIIKYNIFIYKTYWIWFS